MKPLSVVVVACILASVAEAAAVRTTEADKVDDYVVGEMQAQHVPGLALGVMRDGKIVKAQGYGLANVELNVPLKPESIFQTGSVGKQFTATAVMMLVEEGKIRLDDEISKYFEGAPASWKDITLRNLLTHTSGIPDYESDEFTKPGGLINLRLDYTEDELFKKIATLPLDFAPGEKWRYSNTGYLLLGILLHKVTGQFYGDFLQERIFKPLAMSSTRIISEADIIPNRSAGYRLVKGALKNQDWVSPTLNSTADGALYTNIPDMAKWDAALYTEKLLKKASLDQMWTPVTLHHGKTYPYGFGWDVKEVRGHRLIEHGGAWQGFTAYIARYLDDKLTVVVLTNLDAAYSHPGKVAHNVAGLYIPEVKPAELKPIADKEPQVTVFLREVLEKIATGKADPETFAPDLRKELFPAGIQGVGELLKSFGPMKSLDLVERKEEEGQRAYTYRAVFHDTTLFLRLRLSQDGKIAYLEPAPE
jgi:CubicO group peptidase (beta-lactamase class C family)